MVVEKLIREIDHYRLKSFFFYLSYSYLIILEWLMNNIIFPSYDPFVLHSNEVIVLNSNVCTKSYL